MIGIQNIFEKPIIKHGNKFGLLAFSNLCNIKWKSTFKGVIDDYLFSLQMADFEVSEWEKWLGEIKYNRLMNSNYVIVLQRPSSTPEILNVEDENLKSPLVKLYQSLIITIPFISHKEAFLVLGYNDNGINVLRHMEFYQEIPKLENSPTTTINQNLVKQALKYSKILSNISTQKKHKRLVAMINTFTEGIQSRNIGRRIHNFVRCIEGFILPAPGKTKQQFKSRTELFLGPSKHEFVQELYEIRSNDEHLHDPFESYPDIDEKVAQKKIFKRTLQAEFLARSILKSIFDNDKLVSLFDSYSKLSEFWDLDPIKRKSLFIEEYDPYSIFNV